MQQVRYCSACGHQNAATARFCVSCGQPMQMPTPQPPTPAPAPPTPQRGSRLGLIGAILGIIGIAVVFIPPVGAGIAVPIIGLLVSAWGFIRNRRRGLRKRMAIAGIAVNGVAIVIATIALATVDNTTFKSFDDFTCEDLTDKVIELSKERGDVEILKIYSPTEVEDSEYELECEATAQTSKGEKDIRFQLEQDADGDWFYGFQYRDSLFD